MNEIIYVLTNEAMPGYVKIGKTTNNLEQRVRDLSASTSVPLPFTVFYACKVKLKVAKNNFEMVKAR